VLKRQRREQSLDDGTHWRRDERGTAYSP
jgi:hypothetical protein